MSVLLSFVFMVVLHLISLFSEADEIHKICNVIGSPDEQSWPQGLSLAEAMKYQFPQVKFTRFFPRWYCLKSKTCVDLE